MPHQHRRPVNRKGSPWSAAITFGVIGVTVVGIVAYAKHAQGAPAAPAGPPLLPALPALPAIPTLPVPSSATLPATSPYAIVVIDPTQVREAQNEIANHIGQTNNLGITFAGYGPADVDGNPNNPKWMQALAVLQQAFNVALPAIALTGELPLGYPTQLRTDGILDQASRYAIMD